MHTFVNWPPYSKAHSPAFLLKGNALFQLSLVFFLLFSLQGCLSNRMLHIGGDSQTVYGLPITKQKQRIAFLQKKLEIAEKNLRKAQDEVELLNGDLHQSQLALIEKQIENHEQQLRKARLDPKAKSWGHQAEASTLFLKEREILQQMMESGPSPAALDAQMILDRILRMITELKDMQDARYVPDKPKMDW
jgi:hypothetical protein